MPRAVAKVGAAHRRGGAYGLVGTLLMASFGGLGWPSQAAAHDPPAGWKLVFATPEAPMPSVVVSNRGLVFIDDQFGPTLNLRCDESYRAPAAEVPTVMTIAGGGLMVALYHGVYRTTDGACSLEPGTGLPDATLGPVVATDNARLVTSRLADDGDAVFASTDEGATWTARHDNPAGEYFESLIVAPSAPKHVYAQAFAAGARHCAFSDDSGNTFEARAALDNKTLLAVHPERPEVLFAYTQNPDDAGNYWLLRSGDGCASFEQVLSLPTPPSAIEAGAEDRELWLGVPSGGAVRAPADGEAPAPLARLYRSRDDGADFTPVLAGQVVGVTCLARRGSRVFACATVSPNQAGIWQSDDDFATLTPLMSFADVTQPIACQNPVDRALCAEPWYDFSSEKSQITKQSATVVLDAGVAADDGGGADETKEPMDTVDTAQALDASVAGAGQSHEDAGSRTDRESSAMPRDDAEAAGADPPIDMPADIDAGPSAEGDAGPAPPEDDPVSEGDARGRKSGGCAVSRARPGTAAMWAALLLALALVRRRK